MPAGATAIPWIRKLVSLRSRVSVALVASILAGMALAPANLEGASLQSETQGGPRAPIRLTDDADVFAANVGGTPTTPAIDVADCSGGESLTNIGLARYFLSVRSSLGANINNASGRIVVNPLSFALPLPGSGSPQLPPAILMTNGDLESQANDGTSPDCLAAANDGNANDLGSAAIASFPALSPISLPGLPPAGTPLRYIVVTAPGFLPQVMPISTDDATAPCNLSDQRICLISMGLVSMAPLSAPAGRGVLAGSVFDSNGNPLDGATVLVTDVGGLPHTRVSGTDCDGAALNTAVPTGFYCVMDSTGDQPGAGGNLPAGGNNNGQGLTPGPASVVVINNTSANCPVSILGNAGAVCGFLPTRATTVVTAGAVVGRDVSLQNKTAPSASQQSSTGPNAFGYIVDSSGNGVAGLTISAAVTAGGAPIATGFCPTAPATQATCANGHWAINLPSTVANGTVVFFTLSGPNVSATNVRSVRTGAANGSTGVNPAAPLTVARAVGAPGTWIDPNWVITQLTAGNVATLNGVVTLQGLTLGSSAYQQPIEVRIYQPGGVTPIQTLQTTTDVNGNFSVTNITPGVYDVEVKEVRRISRISRNLLLSAGVNAKTFGDLVAGDVNGDNAVALADFSQLRASYGRCEGETGYRPTADFNGDNCIGLPDFSRLRANFGTTGPLTAP